jgi:hypothetical protein
MDGKLIGHKTEVYLNNAMQQPNSVTNNAPVTGTNVGRSYTFEITGDWQQHDNNGAYYCTAKRFYFDPETKKYQLDDDFEYQLYSPADENSEPEYGTGEKVRAIYNGNWEIVAGVGGGGESRIFAVVMSAIQCPTDSTASPDDDDDFRDKMGEIKIEGKSYDTDDPRYDTCACRELAGKDDGYPEQIVKGTQIEVIKAGSYDNPDYDPDDEDSDEPEKLDWYVAINTARTYNSKLNSDVNSGETTTVTIKDSDGTEVIFTVYAGMADEETYWKGDSSSFDIERRNGDNGIVLQIVNGMCPIAVEEEDE